MLYAQIAFAALDKKYFMGILVLKIYLKFLAKMLTSGFV